MRTWQEYSDVVFNEILKGRLRQGWGYDNSQDLHVLQRVVDEKKNDCWTSLTQDQKDAFSNLIMYDNRVEGGRIKKGDIILTPNLPRNGFFSLMEVSGDYTYDILNFGDGEHDLGHILPVQLLSGTTGVNKFNEFVDANIRRTLRCRLRIWSLDGYSEAIDAIIGQLRLNKSLSSAVDASTKLDVAWDSALKSAQITLVESLGKELDSKFKAAEWEEPLVKIFEKLYPDADVQHTGGPSENGADIVINLPNHFDPSCTPFRIVIQVKNFTNIMSDTHALDQIRTAIKSYSSGSHVIAAVILSTANSVSDEFLKELSRVQADTVAKVTLMLRDDVLRLISTGMGKTFF